MDISILFEDTSLLVINKPAGLLVHPIPGGHGETLIDWLVQRYPDLNELAWPDHTRPGVVHRLDRDTSGVMLVAKTPIILAQLQNQFAQRTVQKTYLALVIGIPDWTEKNILAPVSRGDGTRRKATYLSLPGQDNKPAETDFIRIEQFRDCALIEAHPKTGRTHQIRVHLGLLEHPILGDPWYQTKVSRNLAKKLDVPRLMLHAADIHFIHPDGKNVSFRAELPADFVNVLQQVRREDLK